MEASIVELELTAEVASASAARRALADLVAQTQTDALAVSLCVSEAVTNAVVHAYRDHEPGPIVVTASEDDGGLEVVVRDFGCGLALRDDSPGMGLGLPLMTTMADRFELLPARPGTQVRLWFAAVID